ncbi:MAG TPA: STAS domain-containing protein [Actinomycetospora sp.]|nr:STAS domain-containing protein [Actinomycetospora sp.]
MTTWSSPSSPAATIEISHVGAVSGAVITVTGVIGTHDAAVLARHLHTVLDAGPAVVVVNLSHVEHCDQAGLDALAAARDRAREDAIGLHVVDLAGHAPRRWLTHAGGAGHVDVSEGAHLAGGRAPEPAPAPVSLPAPRSAPAEEQDAW